MRSSIVKCASEDANEKSHSVIQRLGIIHTILAHRGRSI